MSDPRILAIDVGTQSVRAIVFDRAGEVVAAAQVMIIPYVSPQPGWAEQEAPYFFDRVAEACQRLWSEVDPGTLTGVTLTSQRGTVINLDADGQPLRPAMIWPDDRRVHDVPPLGGLWGAAFRLAGVSETIAGFQANAETNWIRRHQPEIWEKTAHFVLLSGYLTYRLTGRLIDSVGCQVAYIPFDFKALRWAGDRDWKWPALGLTRSQLIPVVTPGEPLGSVSAEASAATGIPAGLPMIAAAADKACEVLGTGCVAPDAACLSYGTTATINTTQTRYVEVIPLVPPYPAALPGAYNTEVQIYRGYWLVSWFKQEFAVDLQARAAAEGVAVEALLDAMIKDLPPGADGLLLQPFWTPGVRDPGPEGRGAILGFMASHGRAHLYRAILEGIAFGLRAARETIERRTKAPIRELKVAGGGSRSDVAMQLTADIFGMPASRAHLYEASALGAAIVASVGLGVHPSVQAASAAMTRPGERFEPDPRAQRTYDAIFRRVYTPMYGRLRPLYRALREITGLPE
ncbi:MAG: FGGY-family carbohydrate kinase [Nannocystaceae bacterium]